MELIRSVFLTQAEQILYDFCQFFVLYMRSSLLNFRNYFGGPVYLGKERLAGKTVIITGATTGIGKESAAQLAEKGINIS